MNIIEGSGSREAAALQAVTKNVRGIGKCYKTCRPINPPPSKSIPDVTSRKNVKIK